MFTQYLGENPEEATTYVQSSAGSKYNTGYRYAAKAPNISLPESNVSLLKDSVINGARSISFSLKSHPEVHQLMLYADTIHSFKNLKLNGLLVEENDSVGKRFYNRKHNHLLRYYRTDNDSLTVAFTIKEEDSLPSFTLLAYRFNLLENKALNVRPREVTMTPKPFVNTDALVLQQKFSLEDFVTKKNDSIE